MGEDTTMTLIPRFAFVPLVTWEQYGQEKWPNAVSYGNYKVISYDSSKDSPEVKAAADATGLPQVHYSESNAQMIIDGMKANEQKLFNCNLNVAQEVAASFNIELD